MWTDTCGLVQAGDFIGDWIYNLHGILIHCCNLLLGFDVTGRLDVSEIVYSGRT